MDEIDVSKFIHVAKSYDEPQPGTIAVDKIGTDRVNGLFIMLFAEFIELAKGGELSVSNRPEFGCRDPRDYVLKVSASKIVFEERRSDGPCAYSYRLKEGILTVRGQERPITDFLAIETKWLGAFRDMASKKVFAKVTEVKH